MRTLVVQIIDDVLAIFVKDGSLTERVIAWFWKEGKLAFDIREDFEMTDGDWTMLSSRLFAFTSTEDSGSIHVFSFSSSKPPKLEAKFNLPTLNPNTTIHAMTIHAGPFCANLPSKDLFASDWTRHMVVLELDYMTTIPDADSAFLLCFRNDTLLSRLDLGSDHESPRPAIEWEEWGSGKSLLYSIGNDGESYNWMRYGCSSRSNACLRWLPWRYVHGQRVILPYDDDTDSVSIFDFSQGACEIDQREMRRPSTGLMQSRSILSEKSRSEVGLKSLLFKAEFLPGIPYRMMTKRLPESKDGYSGFMIDEKRIIALKVCTTMEWVFNTNQITDKFWWGTWKYRAKCVRSRSANITIVDTVFKLQIHACNYASNDWSARSKLTFATMWRNLDYKDTATRQEVRTCRSIFHYDVACLSSLVIRTSSRFADTLRTVPASLLVYKKRPSGSAKNVLPPLNLTTEMFKPWSFHHHYQQAHHQNPYVHMRTRWQGRGPSRLLWFAIGAGSACVWIAHKEAHEGRKSQYWNHCFKAPIQVPPMLPSSPNQTTAPTSHEHTNERWQHWNRMSEQQWREEREHVLHMKKQAQDSVRCLLVHLSAN